MFQPTKLIRAGLLLAAAIFAINFAPAQSLNVEVANMRQELIRLREQVGELQLEVESLRREVSETRASAAAGKQSYATVNQLHDAIAEINRLIKDSGVATKADTLRTVSSQMDKLVKQTNDALNTMAKNINSGRRGGNTASATVPTFSDNYPKDGISYTVQPGDNLSVIARKTGAKTGDIINANRIADPTKLMPGQKLFIPGAKEPAPPSPVAPAAN
ncbi:LysM repeat protein [Ereboglobus sp. PH5-5]|uniref:lytic transglycosylase n=1 Tax=unclassified Ereboglobus TaxID=2626932 RepID=UPI0024062CE9|nr:MULTISPECIES: LysM peptidoglycan-binding domain-containing protein [unclassified Ereboglobus]MDF9827075.1 LysM repeat protein [Ereboglobus sp. PH5-10]MDF9832490.1 LysM repeat protein [Ereboglobus sp. PH5-5]